MIHFSLLIDGGQFYMPECFFCGELYLVVVHISYKVALLTVGGKMYGWHST